MFDPRSLIGDTMPISPKLHAAWEKAGRPYSLSIAFSDPFAIPTSASPSTSMLCPFTVLLTSTGTGGPLKSLRPRTKYQPILIAAKPAKTTDA